MRLESSSKSLRQALARKEGFRCYRRRHRCLLRCCCRRRQRCFRRRRRCYRRRHRCFRRYGHRHYYVAVFILDIVLVTVIVVDKMVVVVTSLPSPFVQVTDSPKNLS